ncbi:MAG: hypothetical protein NTY41_05575 [Proteobacteria bacterium]|nr:hypothetical protein [Pseudomonadota bacterium]
MPKTTIRVRSKRWDFFNRECKVMSLRRDDLLNRILPGEIEILAAIPACDAAGSRWIKQRWVTMREWGTGDLELVNVPVLLLSDVVDNLNTICAEKGVPRDAFLDCFLQYLTTRLHDTALVIKNPRTSLDLGSQIAAVMMDEDIDKRTVKEHLFEVASDWIQGRSLDTWSGDFYSTRLSYDAARVEEEQLMLEAFALSL